VAPVAGMEREFGANGRPLGACACTIEVTRLPTRATVLTGLVAPDGLVEIMFVASK
jgi:enamine deaminase RidA (YjgF/YER057c/UK114 family)